MFKIADIFTDHMVLQRQQTIRVFGECDEAGDITVELNGFADTVCAKDGKWVAHLPEMEAGGPYEMKVSFKDTQLVIKDILLGDIWIASGQSNMEFPLIFEYRGLREAKQAYNPNIRLYTCSREVYPGHEEYTWAFEKVSTKRVPWSICDEESVLHFSAIGYFVAKQLNEELDIPIGVISANKGGMPIDTFAPEEAFENEHYKPVMDEYNRIKLPDEEAGAHFDEVYKQTQISMDNDGVTMEELVRRMGVRAATVHGRKYPAGELKMCKYHPKAPAVLYNVFMRDQIKPLAVKGVLWYQGESSRFDRNYADKFKIMTDFWRRDLENEDMPFYTVEVAAHDYWCDTVPDVAYLRAEQWRATKLVKNTYITSTQDMGDAYDIHPDSKLELSERIANQILNHTYGIEKYCECPAYDSHEIKGKEVWIKLKNADGFFGSDIAKELKICGDGDVYVTASFRIEGDTLVVWNDGIEKPKNVRYCFTDFYSRGGFFNKSGLPLAPFATDVY